jgi:hypothetical protein
MIMKNRLSGNALGGKGAGTPAGEGMRGPTTNYFRTLEETIAEHPGLSVAAAVLAGLLVAWWIKRR